MQAKNIILTKIKLRHTALVMAYGNTTKNIKSYDIVTIYRCHNPGLRHGNMFAPLLKIQFYYIDKICTLKNVFQLSHSIKSLICFLAFARLPGYNPDIIKIYTQQKVCADRSKLAINLKKMSARIVYPSPLSLIKIINLFSYLCTAS